MYLCIYLFELICSPVGNENSDRGWSEVQKAFHYICNITVVLANCLNRKLIYYIVCQKEIVCISENGKIYLKYTQYDYYY